MGGLTLVFGNFFSFPNPVNEYAARTVAGCVLILSLVASLTLWLPLAIFLAYGFTARVLTGPTMSPVGLLATRLIVPKIIKKEKDVAGPPKRFAQAIGFLFSASALLLLIGDQGSVARILYLVLALFAALESIISFCAGCWAFGLLMRAGLIPEKVCLECNNLNFGESRSD
tara:strand:+ start:54 stop:566 length:513 start_codon:yes stop_codon:yes gene_type:complete